MRPSGDRLAHGEPDDPIDWQRPEWHALAACGRNGVIGDDPAERVKRMFPTDDAGTADALEPCANCPVVNACDAAGHPFGVWGGKGQRHRGTGRTGLGAGRGNGPRFTTDEVLAIRAAYRDGASISDLAKRYERTYQAVHGIVRNRTHRNIAGDDG